MSASDKLADAIRNELPHMTVFSRSDKGYDDAAAAWNLYTQYSPLVIAQPKAVSDVAPLVKIAHKLGVGQITARSGGHSFEGASLGGKNRSALVVDMVNLTAIKTDPQNHRLEAEGGALLGHIYQHAWDSGHQMIPMGSCVGVGAGGQLQCGGYGFYTRAYGVALDYVEEFDIVIADGTVLTCNDKKNDDLYFAVRGSGTGSYGVITRLAMRTLDAPKGCAVFTIQWPLKTTDIAKQLKQIEKATFAAHKGLSPMIVVWQGLLEISGSILAESDAEVGKIWDKYVADCGECGGKTSKVDLSYCNFRDSVVKLVQTQTSAPWYDDLNEVRREGTEHIRFMKIKAGFIPKPFDDKFLEDFGKFAPTQPEAAIRVQILGLDPNYRPSPDTTSIKCRGAPWLMGMSVWTPAAQFGGIENAIKEGKKRLPWLEHAYEIFYPYTSGGYIGDDDIEETSHTRDMYRSYWGDHLERLVEVKCKYDPQNRFHHPLSIPLSIDKTPV